jgi:hypothetical protein
MNTLSRSLLVLTAVLACTPSQAQLFRTYVASDGNDANPCTLTQPCRLLPAAITAVADGGEIWMLDSANYNTSTVFIGKSVTVMAVPGVVGSIVGASQTALLVSTGTVQLRNLMFVPLAGSTGLFSAIIVQGLANLDLLGCTISGFPGQALFVGFGGNVLLSDSMLRRNGIAAGLPAIRVLAQVAATTTTIDIANTTIQGSLTGLQLSSTNATATIRASIRDSRIYQGAERGIDAISSAGASVNFTASNNMIVGTQAGGAQAGIRSSGSGVYGFASGNTVAGFTTGIENVGATFTSFGNNALQNNGIASTGVTTTALQ